ncbi:T9SS type A sorting domain-containing protein [Dyadobacter sp. CY312]|uniref:T9SS type A sorting domain-containing protein n=1 Tax=Dyadobacter sp. CY312 TaxID=2907303 RepID=UPI001F20F0A8|nr:T9SS type A sorting domain-containing protein [Dyadobacter sp. CY312]MCE7038749.1 T9SS type A sorting domain-containing protein [Dyadobacter sp. CY312]
MKILLKLALSGGIAVCMAATSQMVIASTPEGKENTTVTSEVGAGKTANDPGYSSDPLGQTLQINNPYTNNADKPFTIVEESYEAAGPLASQVYCGERYWVHGEVLGHNRDNGEIKTELIEGRIYIRLDSREWGTNRITKTEILKDWGTLFHTIEGRFPVGEWDARFKRCLNGADPSAFLSNGILQGPQDGGIKCGNYIFKDGDFIGAFHRSTDPNPIKDMQYARIRDGRLRVQLHQSGTTFNPDALSFNLILQTVTGENGSTVNPAFTPLTELMIKSCFWDQLPVYPEPDPMPTCNTAPTIGTIGNTTQTSLQYTYSGNGVTSVKWKIRLASNNNEVASGTSNSTSNTITFNSLAFGDYKLEIEGNNCKSDINSRNFKIEPPVVVVPDCQNGPSISSITNITPSTAAINFAGTNLSDFSWRILSGSNVVGYGKTGKLNTKTANVEFNYLPAANYTFELTAQDCKTTTKPTQTFAVPSVADSRTNCDRGPSLESIQASSETGLTFKFDGNGVYGIDWKIMQGGTVIRQNRVKPQSNTPYFEYPSLQNGTYTLQIQGGTCTSDVTARTFTVNNSLPIYIANFKGNVVEKGVELSWEVVSEKNGEGFEILRLDDQAKSSEVIGKISLTDKKTGTYKFVDEAPLLGTNYYQLKQIDLDGSFMKSNIISVTPGIITGTVVAPNPARDFVNIQFSSRAAGTADLEIYNISGIKISTSQLSIKEGKNNHRIPVGKLSEGNYFMKVSHGGESSKLRFIKAN